MKGKGIVRTCERKGIVREVWRENGQLAREIWRGKGELAREV